MNALEFLNDYFNEDEYFIIAQKYPKINDKVKHHHSMLNIKNKYTSNQLQKFHYLNKDKDADIYFSLNTYKFQRTYIKKRSEEFVHSIKSFYFDIDKGDIEAKKEEIIQLCGEPTYIIESSLNKFQFIYKFKEPYMINSIEDRNHFKQLLKGLTYKLIVDRVFDTARIFRLTDYMNKKPQNDNFKVTIQKYENYYSFEEFENIAKNYVLDESPKKKTTQHKSKSSNKSSKSTQKAPKQSNSSFAQYKPIKKIINRKYKEFVSKYDGDKSTADLAYAKWLRYSKQINNDQVIIKKIFAARGYAEILEVHGYQLEYYFENILEKSL